MLAGYPLLSRSPKTLRREPSQPSAVQVERCWRLPQIHARKPPQHGRVVQRLFGPGENGRPPMGLGLMLRIHFLQ